MSRAVRLHEYGDVDVLHVEDVDPPIPRPGEVVVRVRAAGINPGEAKIRTGALHAMYPASFPSGQGSDLAGVVDAVADGVDAFAVGDEVLGWSDERSSQAELVRVPAGQLTAKPPAVPWEVAGALFVAGATAWATVRAVVLSEGDVVVVSGAAGGVGTITVQLARRAGAEVIGLAGERNHAWLRGHGVIPVTYGDGMQERITAAAPGPVTAFIDLAGGPYVELALALGVAPKRIDTIVDFGAVQAHGVKSEGNAQGASAAVLAELAALIADGALEVPIAATYPLDEVREAYTELERGHTRGKIVLVI
ncbi:MAG TPA: NADP-dependent oxidoreductase [Solirubrobacteraceae bacterium]|nr:NADP-dependent oxidoreductase [Solirubrobacteraceae bacterium]